MPADRCSVMAWRPDVAGVAEVFHAHITDWSYPAHAHDTWTLLIVDRGAIDYSLDRKRCEAFGDLVAVLPPGVVHDGRPAPGAAQGFWKRNLCLDADAIPERLVGAAVDRARFSDPPLRAALSALHDSLAEGADAVETDARVSLVCDRLHRRLDGRHRTHAPEVGVAHRLRTWLDDRTDSTPSLAEAAAHLDRSIPHLVRSFSAAFGISPHAYLIGRRVEAARGLLHDGLPAAQVAVDAGFYDQSHFTKHFKRHTGTTPARYVTGPPGRR